MVPAAPGSFQPCDLHGPPVPRGRGLFVTGTDTDVGKTSLAVAILHSLRAAGVRVAACKPVASGVAADGGDPARLWEAAGRPGRLEAVCPQTFTAAIAPARAAAAEGRRIDEALLAEAVRAWLPASELVVVEGAGGLFSPLSERLLNLDLAAVLELPLVVCDDARLGAIGRTLATVRAARAEGLRVAAVVLSQVTAEAGQAGVQAEASSPSSPAAITRAGLEELTARLPGLPVALLGHDAGRVEPPIDWAAVAAG
jgi:dethiobiotin synthetase